ncbi:MAG: ribosomal L7Ae/L30e/S12e/Gadd45 family protein [Clostridia bacterium]|nr:ribosomal L7Ae/L30e/S12e/Gadd45 family protein [Clostridia bacterium]
MSNKVFTYLGFAQRAGKLVSGDSGGEAVFKKGKAKMVIVAEDAPERTKDNFSFKAKEKDIPFRVFGTKMELGRFIGKSPRSVLVITDQQFADTILRVFNDKFNGDEL